MIRYLILCSIFCVSCSKQDSSYVKTENENNSNTSSLTRERVDSLLVSNNIFQISYNEKYEQPNWVKYTVRDIVKNADRDGIEFYTVDSIYTSDDDDYYSNRWDRGHMAPAGSFNDSYENLYSTFSYINVALQYDDLNRGAWVDLENQVSDQLLLGGSFRYEDYSSFGDTNDFKLNARYQLNENVAWRFSTGTGFRAPTQGQVNVVNTQTTLVDGQLTQAQTLPGFKLGAGQLKPEEATNTSFGIVYNAGDLSVTADFFSIELDDRVALTSNAAPTSAQVAAMGAAGIPNPELIGQVNYFTNDFDTETTGYDIVAVYSTELFGADADISAAWNHTETEVTNSGAVTGASKVRRLEEGLPEDRMTITVAQTWSDKVSSFVRANMYGEYYAVHADWFGTTADAEWTVDASVSVQVTDNFSVSAGVQNLFDTEALKIDGSAGANGEGVPGNVLGGIYYETSPYGIEGAFWYVKAGYNF